MRIEVTQNLVDIIAAFAKRHRISFAEAHRILIQKGRSANNEVEKINEVEH